MLRDEVGHLLDQTMCLVLFPVQWQSYLGCLTPLHPQDVLHMLSQTLSSFSSL